MIAQHLLQFNFAGRRFGRCDDDEVTPRMSRLLLLLLLLLL